MVALADPKRCAIFSRLAQGEARVAELAAPLDVPLNAVSKHIKLRARVGLVRRRRIGCECVLRFKPEPLGTVPDWLMKQKAFRQTSLEAMDDMLQR